MTEPLASLLGTEQASALELVSRPTRQVRKRRTALSVTGGAALRRQIPRRADELGNAVGRALARQLAQHRAAAVVASLARIRELLHCLARVVAKERKSIKSTGSGVALVAALLGERAGLARVLGVGDGGHHAGFGHA